MWIDNNDNANRNFIVYEMELHPCHTITWQFPILSMIKPLLQSQIHTNLFPANCTIHSLDVPTYYLHPLSGCYSNRGHMQRVMQLVSHNGELSIFISNNILHIYKMAAVCKQKHQNCIVQLVGNKDVYTREMHGNLKASKHWWQHYSFIQTYSLLFCTCNPFLVLHTWS
jgi:hypothetical protein